MKWRPKLSKSSIFLELFENLSDEKKDAVINFFESFTLNEIESFVKHLPSSKNKKKRNCLKKIAVVSLLILTILLSTFFGAFAFSSDFRHAAMEVFEDEGDDYSRVSSASTDRGTADAVTLINYTAINCKGGRKGMEIISAKLY